MVRRSFLATMIGVVGLVWVACSSAGQVGSVESSEPTPEFTTTAAVPDSVEAETEPADGATLVIQRQVGDDMPIELIDERGKTVALLPLPEGCDGRCVARAVVGEPGNDWVYIVTGQFLLAFDRTVGSLEIVGPERHTLPGMADGERFIGMTDNESVVRVIDLHSGSSMVVPVQGGGTRVHSAGEVALVTDQQGPDQLVDPNSGSVQVLPEDLTVLSDPLGVDRTAIAASRRTESGREVVVIDATAPEQIESWFRSDGNFVSGWVGERMVVIELDGTVSRVGPGGVAEVATIELLGEEVIVPNIVATDAAGRALVRVTGRRGSARWFRVDAEGGSAAEVAELEGLDVSFLHPGIPGVVLADDHEDDPRYERLVAAPVADGPVVSLVGPEDPWFFDIAAAGDDRVYLRGDGPDNAAIVDLRTGTSVVTIVGANTMVSPDGRWLASTVGRMPDSAVVLIDPMAPGDPHAVADGWFVGWLPEAGTNN